VARRSRFARLGTLERQFELRPLFILPDFGNTLGIGYDPGMRLRFSLRTLLIAVTAVALVAGWWVSTIPKLAGTWQGLDRFNNYTFDFDGSKMSIKSKYGAVSTPYTLSMVDGVRAIDFNGNYGPQLGIYEFGKGGFLTMIVADPGTKRPTDLNAAEGFGTKIVRYMLCRGD
jgi:hypothetical protein